MESPQSHSKATNQRDSQRHGRKEDAATPIDDIYYMFTPALPEDEQLRKKLWNDRLVN